MWAKPFFLKQMTRGGQQAIVFILCVTLSIVTISALESLTHQVNTALTEDARALHAADIIVRSRLSISNNLANQIKSLENAAMIKSARVYEFYSMARAVDRPDSLLAKLKVVEKGYPFYGHIELASGRPFQQVLAPGNIIVAPLLLERLGLGIGDRMKIGNSQLTIVDTVIKEPDRPLNFFALGPRIFISADDLDALDLLKKGSRIRYLWLIKVADDSQLEALTSRLKKTAGLEERVNTYRTANSRIKRFLNNFFFFLALVGMLILLLAGFGIQSAMGALLRDNQKTIAIMKAIGAKSDFIIRQYLLIAFIYATVGIIIGHLLGLLLHNLLFSALAPLLPEALAPTLTATAIIKALVIGFVAVAVFTFLPLQRVKFLKPTVIFRKERVKVKKNIGYFCGLVMILLVFVASVLWHINDYRTGIYFVLGILAMVLLIAVFTQFVLWILNRLPVRSLLLRQALKGLFRPGNATRAIIISLTASVTVIFAIYLVERNLDASFVESYPSDTPNLFFLDIQPSQLADFKKTLGKPAEFYPIVRARVIAVNDEKIDRQQERQRRGDNLARVFNLTYRHHLLADERIREGQNLFQNDVKGVQVSLLDTVQEIRSMRIGDRITFRIQGIPLEATITSIRTRTKESLRPFFYFVFPQEVLETAPQTIFTAINISKTAVADLQNRIVTRFPNISVVDITEALAVVAGVMQKLSKTVRFFTVFSIAAGVLIIISSVLATRIARIREAVYYKVLGARRSFILKVFTLENMFLGLISGALALAIAQVGSWLICKMVLNIDYQPFAGASLLMIIATMLLVVTVSLPSSLSILNQKPVSFLREQTQE